MERMEDRIIKDGPKPLYLIHGENQYLRETYLKELIRILKEDREQEVFEDRATLDEILLSASMLSLFSQGKLILQRNPQWLQKGEEEEALLSWLETAGREHVLLLTWAGKADGRRKLIKTLKAKGMLIECPLVQEWELTGWVIGQFKARGHRIGKNEAEILLTRAGSNQAMLQGEIQKICLFAGKDRKITPAMVEELASASALSGIFDLLDAFSAQDGAQLLKHYRSLIQMKEPEIKILFMLAKQIRILYQGKLLRNEGLEDGAIVKALGVNPYVWKKARPHALRMGEDFLRQALYQAGELDYRMKSGQGQPAMLMETFLISFCQGRFQPHPENPQTRDSV